jgi:hypothetical protein
VCALVIFSTVDFDDYCSELREKIDCVFPWRLFMDGLVRLMDIERFMGWF